MARLTIEDCVRQVPNRFDLIRLTTLRAKQLRRGARAMVRSENGEIVTALRETAAGFVQPCHQEEASPGEASPLDDRESRARVQKRQPTSSPVGRGRRSFLVVAAESDLPEIGAPLRPSEPDVSLDEENFFDEEVDELDSGLDGLLEDEGLL
jgi:DNA-directed RNA polymerase subunit omega